MSFGGYLGVWWLARVVAWVVTCDTCQCEDGHRQTGVVVQNWLLPAQHLAQKLLSFLQDVIRFLIKWYFPLFCFISPTFTFPFLIQATWSGTWMTWSTTQVSITSLPVCTWTSLLGWMKTRGVTTIKSISFRNLNNDWWEWSFMCIISLYLFTELTWHWYEPSSMTLTSRMTSIHLWPTWLTWNLVSGMKTSSSTARMCLSLLLTQDTDLFVTSSTPHSKKAVVPA